LCFSLVIYTLLNMRNNMGLNMNSTTKRLENSNITGQNFLTRKF
jgi:hypothetical protein